VREATRQLPEGSASSSVDSTAAGLTSSGRKCRTRPGSARPAGRGRARPRQPDPPRWPTAPAGRPGDTATVRLALAACARSLTGKAAGRSTQRRKRSVSYHAHGYAVEQGTSHPTRSTASSGRPPPSRRASTGGWWSAVMLREAGLYLPKKGWEKIVLAASASRAGTAWTDDGTARQERGLKHRADNETRTIPIPPTSSGCCAPTSSGTAPPLTAGSSRPPGAASSRTPARTRSGPNERLRRVPGRVIQSVAPCAPGHRARA
jgi:hypothetical protein